jgi:hypothetical protein
MSTSEIVRTVLPMFVAVAVVAACAAISVLLCGCSRHDPLLGHYLFPG